MLRKDIKNFINTLPNAVKLVVASKSLDLVEMNELYDLDIRDFGENRVDSFLTKYHYYEGREITWHFIGHLQRNKAKKVINKIDYLHSLDSLELAALINQERTTVLDTFIEVSINEEESKNGVKLADLDAFVQQVLSYPKIHLIGLMMMAKDGSSEEELHHQFKTLRDTRDLLEKKYQISLPHLSMGMSNDYLIAIAEGATFIRLGRIIKE